MRAREIEAAPELLRSEPGAEPAPEVWEIACFNDSHKAARRLGHSTPLAAGATISTRLRSSGWNLKEQSDTSLAFVVCGDSSGGATFPWELR
ncbi:hypothetical protein LBMAG42_57020 [Deltaproteobacteria bacterium]|nr:hypothetical protein LBMAG42_57020 [Deltaproteobacteria bacterium]